MLRRVSRVLVFTLLVVSGPTAFGQGVNPATSPTDTNHSLTYWFGQLEPPVTWTTTIGTRTNPIGVELDPAGPAWVQHFQTSNQNLIDTQREIRIWENLVVGGDRPWTGWHAVLTNPDFYWVWIPGTVNSLQMKANGVPVPVTINFPVHGVLDATFPAIAPGTQIELSYYLVRLTADPPTNSFDILQSPVPEPVSLLGFAFLFLLYRGKR